MSTKIYYAYIIMAILFAALSIYSFIKGNAGYATIYDPIIAIVLFYRVYRIYKTRNDQELM